MNELYLKREVLPNNYESPSVHAHVTCVCVCLFIGFLSGLVGSRCVFPHEIASTESTESD